MSNTFPGTPTLVRTGLDDGATLSELPSGLIAIETERGYVELTREQFAQAAGFLAQNAGEVETDQDTDDRFWVSPVDDEDPNESFGSGSTAAIGDEEAGGIVAYTHQDFADELCNLLNR